VNTKKQFEKFYDSIRLTKIQRNDAKTKYTGVCKKLHDYYYSDLEYNGNTKLLIGSYGKKTTIRPPRDVDVLFIMPNEKFEQYNSHQSNGQSQLLQDIRGILNEKYTTTDSIKAWGKVVKIEFSDNTHNIELLPAWKQDSGSFIIPNTENGGRWEVWNPKTEINKIEKSNSATKGMTRFLIRTVKKWTDNCSVKLKSFQIEEYVLNFFNTHQIVDNDYAVLVKDIFAYMNERPISGTESHIKTALNRAIKAYDFEKNNKPEDATAEWKKILGDDFPKYEEKSLATLEIDSLMKAYPSSEEEFLYRDYGIPIELNPNYKVVIDATVKQNGFRDHFLSFYLTNKLWLSKEKQLIFKIVKNTVLGDYIVKWKVRNFGVEAKHAQDLRGEISDDIGHGEKHEHTRYLGQHFVECYIIQNNICVAMDSIVVPIE